MNADQLKLLRLLVSNKFPWTKRQICLALDKNSLWFFSIIISLHNKGLVEHSGEVGSAYQITEKGRLALKENA
jgi:predicted transcriptional regulator